MNKINDERCFFGGKYSMFAANASGGGWKPIGKKILGIFNRILFNRRG